MVREGGGAGTRSRCWVRTIWRGVDVNYKKSMRVVREGAEQGRKGQYNLAEGRARAWM